MLNFLLNLFKKSPPILIDSEWVDKNWGDTVLKIINIHKTKKIVRYKFLKIDGNLILDSGLHEMSIWSLRELYDINS